MKVVHISTFDYGGAGKSAIRLHTGLMKEGVNTRFLTLGKKTTNIDNVLQYHHSKKTTLYQKVCAYFGISTKQKDLRKELLNNRSGKFEIFSFPFTPYAVHEHPWVRNADVINLHWVADFIDYSTFFTNINKPVVWTLHDMNPFMGGFHYLDDRKRNWSQWKDLEVSFEHVKQTSVSSHANISVVTPSKWLAKAANESKVLGRYSTTTIPYGLNLSVFRPMNKVSACDALNIPSDAINIVFISESIGNERKGFDLLLDALKSVYHKNINVIAIGKSKEPALNVNSPVYYIDSISDERLMAIAINTADCFIIPSREDNFPNVMLEAFSCGKPIISFPVGGMKEEIKTGFNGILTQEVSSESLSIAINQFLNNEFKFSTETIRQFAVDNYSEMRQAKEYIALYKNLMS